MTPEQRLVTKAALFYGKRNSQQFWIWDTIARRDGYIGWSHIESPETKVDIGAKEVTNFNDLNGL